MIAWDDDFCRALAARGFYVVRFDNRDVGLSTDFDAWGDPNPLAVFDELRKHHAVNAPYHLADMADDAAGLLAALGIRAAHVVGVSMGGMIAQELAVRHPERVLTLTSIMSTTGALDVRGPSYETIAAVLAPFPPDRAGFIARSVALARTLHGGGFPFEEARVRAVAARSFDRALRPGGVRRQLVAIWLSGDRTPALRALHVPALVMHGDADPLIPVDGGRATASGDPGGPARDPRRHGARAAAPGLAARHRRRRRPRCYCAACRARAVTDALVARAPLVYPCDYIDKGGLAVTDNARGCSGTPTWQLVVRGALDPAHVRAALADVVTRYPPLRCRVQPLDGADRQRARRFAYVEDPAFSADALFRVVDARDDAALAALVREEQNRPLDLFADFPLTLTLARTGDDGCRLLFRQHHAIADGRAFLGAARRLRRVPRRRPRRPPPRSRGARPRRAPERAGAARPLAAAAASSGASPATSRSPASSRARCSARRRALLQNRSNDYTRRQRHDRIKCTTTPSSSRGTRRASASASASTRSSPPPTFSPPHAVHRARGAPVGRTTATLMMETRPRDGGFVSFANHLATLESICRSTASATWRRWRGRPSAGRRAATGQPPAQAPARRARRSSSA